MELGQYIKRAREGKGLSIRALAALTQSDPSGIKRLEEGETLSPSPDRLARIARALEVDVQDLYAYAGYSVTQGLPTMDVYLRTKYNLPDGAVKELDDYFKYVESKYKHEGESDGDHTG